MKMLDLKRKKNKDFGWIDPDKYHEVTIEDPLYNKGTPGDLLSYFKQHRDKKTILWPYNFK